jgi:hypothetical protein
MRLLFVLALASLAPLGLFAASPRTLSTRLPRVGCITPSARRRGIGRFWPTMQYAHASGSKQTKQEYIAAVTSGPARYESFTLSDLRVDLNGQEAVLTAYCDVKMVGMESFRVRTLQVYTNRNGQWQMSAHQSARMRAPGER